MIHEFAHKDRPCIRVDITIQVGGLVLWFENLTSNFFENCQ